MSPRRVLRHILRMKHPILFKCPKTGMNVQHELDGGPDVAVADTHVSVPCPACASLHFINTTTGKLLGDASSRLAHANSGT